MDTATQALLGAVVGQAAFSHKLGGRALVFGAVGGLIPDLDVIAMVTHGPFGEFVHHRGFTHSLWFGLVAGPILGWLIWRYYRWRGRVASGQPGDPAVLTAWMGLMVLAIWTHPLIDVFTSYGTQLLAPFSTERTALNAVGIIDVVYSGILILALVVGAFLRRQPTPRRVVAWAALILSWGYMGYGWWLNEQAEQTLRAEFSERGYPEAVVRAYPTLLLPYLRRAVVRADGEIWVGLYTPLGGGASHWERFRAQPPHPLVDQLRSTPEGEIFEWFAMRQTHARLVPTQEGTAVEIDDLRYGFPGTPDRGMWGIRGEFDREGNLIAPVRRIRGAGSRALSFGAFWSAMWGTPEDLFQKPGN
jgi:inner membrane protein